MPEVNAYLREPTAQAEEWMKASVTVKQKTEYEIGLKLDPEATKKLNKSGVKVGEKTISGNVQGKDDYLLEMEDFFNSVRTGAPVSCDWKQGIGACVAAIKANEAMEKQTRIEIAPENYE